VVVPYWKKYVVSALSGSTDPSSVADVVVRDSADEVTTAGAVTWSLSASETLTAWLELVTSVVLVVEGVVVVVGSWVVVVTAGVVVVVVELVPAEPEVPPVEAMVVVVVDPLELEPVELVPPEPLELVPLAPVELVPVEDDEEAAGQPSPSSVTS
jgi:hypothetical protein